MPRRHLLRPGDWETVALRLDEIISAQSGEDSFEEALKLVVACLVHELDGGGPFPGGGDGDPVRGVDRLLEVAVRRWPALFEGSGAAPRTRLRAPVLRRCAATLDGVQLLRDGLAGLDALFEFIVGRAAKGDKGQFFTPRHVVEEIVAMVAPRAGEQVADPACGSGAFLRQALRLAPRCAVWGFDHDARASRVAKVMLAASDADPAHVTCLDSLRRPLIEERMRGRARSFAGFDVIVTNPPFAGDVGRGYAQGYALSRSGRRIERDVLFVERCVELLAPGGRLAIVLPHNKIGGEPWAFVRRWLLERVRVVAVLSLGRNTFQPHTGQKACVLLAVRRARPVTRLDGDEEVLFFVSDRDGKDVRGRTLLRPADGLVDHDLGEATALVRARFAGLVSEAR